MITFMKNETVADLQKTVRPPFESWTTSSLRLLPLIDSSKPGDITEATPSPSSSPFSRHGHSLTAATTRDGELFLFGGHANGVKSNDLYSISARKFSITPIRTHGDIPTPRSGHVCAFVSDRLIVWGGETVADGGQTEELDNVLYSLDLDNYEWRRLKTSGSSPSGRCGHSASVIGTMLYIFGGHARGVVRDDLWALDLGKKDGKLSWERISIARRGAPKRTGHACIAYKNQIIIFGGTDLEFYYDDTYILDITTRRWTKEDYAGFSVRKDHSASLIDDTVYVFGGRGPDRKDLKDLLAFRITDRRWYAFTFPDGPMPSACSSHGMASIGSRLFVLGGVPSKTAKGESSPAIHILETQKMLSSNAVGPTLTATGADARHLRSSSSDRIKDDRRNDFRTKSKEPQADRLRKLEKDAKDEYQRKSEAFEKTAGDLDKAEAEAQRTRLSDEYRSQKRHIKKLLEEEEKILIEEERRSRRRSTGSDSKRPRVTDERVRERGTDLKTTEQQKLSVPRENDHQPRSKSAPSPPPPPGRSHTPPSPQSSQKKLHASRSPAAHGSVTAKPLANDDSQKKLQAEQKEKQSQKESRGSESRSTTLKRAKSAAGSSSQTHKVVPTKPPESLPSTPNTHNIPLITIENVENEREMSGLSTRKEALNRLLSELSSFDVTRSLQKDMQMKACGGYADVYLGRLSDGKNVAVKRLRFYLSVQDELKFAKRVARELRVWSKLQHGNILSLRGYALGGSDEVPYPSFVTDWMENGSIAQYIQKSSKIDNFSIIRGIANGLDYLHEQGVIHGDLKAANVLVSPKGAPLLMDFGLSHLVCTTSTVESATSARTGSIRWQSPELLFPPGDSDDDVHTKASDIWAFGMTALEVLTKNIPYQTAKMDTQVIGLIYKGTVPPDPDDLGDWKEIDKALWDFCKRCWLSDPKARPPMRHLLKELKKLKADHPASAHK